MCSKSNKAKPSSSPRASGGQDKTYKKCPECKARKVARDEARNILLSALPNPYMPPAAVNWSRAQFGYDANYEHDHGYAPGYGCGYGYSYDTSVWDNLHPAAISKAQWKDHAQIVENTCNALEENGKLIGEVRGAVTNEIKGAREAIKKAHDSVNSTDAHVQDTLAAIKRTQELIGESHTAQASKQQESAADIARVRQLLEVEAKQREEARRVQEMVQYAQTQGLLQQGGMAGGSRHSSRSSRSRTTSTSPARSTPPPGDNRRQRSPRTPEEERDEETEAERRRHWERERERFEQHQQVQHAHFAESMREFADKQQRMQEEYERWWRRREERQQQQQRQQRQQQFEDEGVEQYARLPRRRDHRRSRHTQSQPQTPTLSYEDDVIEAPPYNTYSYAEYGIGGGTDDARHRGAYSRVRYVRRM